MLAAGRSASMNAFVIVSTALVGVGPPAQQAPPAHTTDAAPCLPCTQILHTPDMNSTTLLLLYYNLHSIQMQRVYNTHTNGNACIE